MRYDKENRPEYHIKIKGNIHKDPQCELNVIHLSDLFIGPDSTGAYTESMLASGCDAVFLKNEHKSKTKSQNLQNRTS